MRKEVCGKVEETQVLYNIACLVFLNDQFTDFKGEHGEVRILSVLKKRTTETPGPERRIAS